MKALCTLLVALCSAAPAFASTYYADMTVDLDSAGTAQVSGVTNHPFLVPQITQNWTTKSGSVWLFNVTLPAGDVFSDYVYAIKLPPQAEISYVKADSVRITSDGERIVVSGSGRDGPLSVLIQYRTIDGKYGDYSRFFYIAAAFLVLTAGAYMFLGRDTRKKPSMHNAGENPGEPHSMRAFRKYEGMLTGRQKDIIKVLAEEGKPVNQAALCQKLGLPKSSVSRNVSTLADLGVLEKKRVGMSTFISLRDE